MNSHHDKKIYIVGLARDCEMTLQPIFSLFDRIERLFSSVRYIFVENSSIDNTRSIIEERIAKKNNAVLLTPCDLDGLPRTVRLARCRNDAINQIKDEALNFDLLLIIDMDLRLGLVDPSEIKIALDFLEESPETSAVFASSVPVYYDIWALRHPFWCPGDCWAEVRSERKFTAMEAETLYVRSRQMYLNESIKAIKVLSAFNGLGLYKLTHIADAFYVGIEGDEETCEHVHFNLQLPGDLFILPRLRVEAPVEHIPQFNQNNVATKTAVYRRSFISEFIGGILSILSRSRGMRK